MESVKETTKLGDVCFIGAVRGDVIEEETKAPNEVSNLGVCPTHRAQWVGPPEHLGQGRVEDVVFGLLVRQHLVYQESVHAANASDDDIRTLHPYGVSRLAKQFEIGADGLVLGAEPMGKLRIVVGQAHRLLLGPEHPECVEDHGHVDGLLEQRTPDCRQIAQPGHGHRHQR